MSTNISSLDLVQHCNKVLKRNLEQEALVLS